MTLRTLLEFKNGKIIGPLSLFKTKLIKDDSIAQTDIDKVSKLLNMYKDGKSVSVDDLEVLFDLGYEGPLSEKFDMKSSLENSIIGWEVALKKTSCSEKKAHLNKRIKTAKTKLEQLSKNSN